MAEFIFGLNTEKSFADVVNPTEALLNLGVDTRDVDIIRPLPDLGLSRNDLKTLSGLDFDIKKEAISISADLSESIQLIEDSASVRNPIPFDLIVDNALQAGSFKYKYLDYTETDLNNLIKGADISTSRLSSWSSFDSPPTSTSPIFYGGDLIVNPSGTGRSQLRITGLDFTDEPVGRKYSAEVPTHLITLNIGGVDKQFYAMQGIPIEFEGFFRNGTVRHRVDSFAPGILPTWEIENLDDGRLTVFEDQGLNLMSSNAVSISDFKARERKLRFYYPPNNIKELNVSGISATQLPNDILPELTHYYFTSNLIQDLPNLAVITPKLSVVDMSRNALYSGVDTEANVELNKLPTSITRIEANYCFRDSTRIDLSSYTNLVRLGIFGTYSGTYMRDSGPTPAVNSSTIESYSIYGHLYGRLDRSVADAPNLSYINIQYNNITSMLDDDGVTPIEIAFQSENLTQFYSLSNSHNIIDFSGQQNLRVYFHRYSRGLFSPNPGSASITGKFNNMPALDYVNFYACDARGDITNEFSNLPALRVIDLRYSRVHGRIANSSFFGTENLRYLRLAGAAGGEDGRTLGQIDNGSGGTTNVTNFFEEDCFKTTLGMFDIIVISNRVVTGELPDLTENRRLWRLYVAATGLSGGLAKQNGFSSNVNLRYLYLHANQIEEPVPQINSNTVYRIYLYGNRLYGRMLPYACPSASHIYMQNNNIGLNSSGVEDPNLGAIPDFSACRNLRELNLGNNYFTGYTPGAFRSITLIRNINLSNNNISRVDAFNILADLVTNWETNNRSGVIVNLTGNGKFTEGDILADEIYGGYLTFLRTAGWSISI